jgi:hypothetical protein
VSDEYAPSRLVTQDNGYSLCFDAFELSDDALEARGLEGGGYTWHAIVDSLVRLHAPEIVERVNCDPEAGMFVAYGDELEALRVVAGLIRRAIQDEALLLEAVAHADPDLLE